MHATIDLKPLLGHLDPSTFTTIVEFHESLSLHRFCRKGKEAPAMLDFLQTASKLFESLRYQAEVMTQIHVISDFYFLIHHSLALNRIVHFLILLPLQLRLYLPLIETTQGDNLILNRQDAI
jgi:hypothetical protein